MNNDLLYKIALGLIPGIGDVLTKTIVSYCGGVENVFKQGKSRLMKIPGIGDVTAHSISSFKNFDRAEQELNFIEKHKIKTFFYLDKSYPTRLKDIQDAPCLLYYLGNADLNHEKIVGVVGTRKASEYGKYFTENLIEELQSTNALILSGLALGIDVCSHKAALKNNLPTVGVLGHGLDRIYPASHDKIAKQMINQGGILTEFMSGIIPDASNFPRRNRIVAGLCDVLVVVETGIKGGARITAEIANMYNKDIMALPGRVSDEHSQGCNYLIKQNKASVITCANDLLELMNWDLKLKNNTKTKQQTLPIDLCEEELKIISFIKQKTKAGIDDLSFELKMDSGNLSLKLLDLEFKNIIRTLPGKFYEMV